MITIEGLTHVYPGTRRQVARQALFPLDLSIAEGEFFVLTGPNGGGKSTLFRILSGLMLPSSGSITVGGADLLGDPAAARRLMGVVFQKPALDKYLTVLENLKIHADLYDMPRALFEERLGESLEWTGLGDRLSDWVANLSGGLARQLELAKALLHHPRLLMMDEPTTGLDPNSRHAFMETIERLRRSRGMTVLMTSHLFAEAEHADTVGILKGGRMLARDTPDNLTSRLGPEVVVIEAEDLAAVETTLQAGEGVSFVRHEREIRVESRAPLALMERVMAAHRGSLKKISIKRPALEDVYIHLTGRSLQQDEEVTP